MWELSTLTIISLISNFSLYLTCSVSPHCPEAVVSCIDVSKKVVFLLLPVEILLFIYSLIVTLDLVCTCVM